MRHPFFFAVSGVKNSGKTTLLEQLVARLSDQGWKVAVIKHDGHEFDSDIPGTDSARLKEAGAYGTVVYSGTKYMAVKESDQLSPEFLAALFPEADIILLEGSKYCPYPKLELIRKGNSTEGVCDPETVVAYVSDFLEGPVNGRPVYSFDRIDHLCDLIRKEWETWRSFRNQDKKASFREKDTEREETLHKEGKRTMDVMTKGSINITNVSNKIMLSKEDYFFGPGIYHLLLKIGELGSIKSASAEMKLSYTKAWKMINRAENGTGVIFLERNTGGRKGGSSTLTPQGKLFLERYGELCRKAQPLLQDLYEEIFEDTK